MPNLSAREIAELTRLMNEQTERLQSGNWEEAVETFNELQLIERIKALPASSKAEDVQSLQLALNSCLGEAERLQAEAAGSFQQVMRFRTSVQDASAAATSAARGGVFVDEQL